MEWPTLLIFPAAVFLISMFGTRILVRQLTQHEILDHPNERSSHSAPTPRGAGIAVIGALVFGWSAMGFMSNGFTGTLLVMSGLALGLAAISWMDDLKDLSPLARLAVQSIAVAIALKMVPLPGPVFGGLLSPTMDLILAGVLWVWFLNLFNFMDGIDGLSGVETLAIGIGVFVISRKGGYGEITMTMGLTMAAAAIGFLRWNWHPSRIFLGDVGSIPLGFMLGWLLLVLAAHGAWAAAIILPFYYLADATVTLIRRILRGEKFWTAHREHFYQRAVASGLRHDQVAGIIFVANLFLIMLAIVSARGQVIGALLGACAAIALLLVLLVKGGPTDP